MIPELNDRSREIFRLIVDNFLTSGHPVGSKTLSQLHHLSLSPASIRGVMADLEEMGLLAAPHTSAGRLPTQAGLRFYIDGMMQSGPLGNEEKTAIKAACALQNQSLEQVYDRASHLLSGLSSCASLVIAPKTNKKIKQIQFILLTPGRVLIVMVTQDGLIENRVMDTPPDLQQSVLERAANYLNAQLAEKDMDDIRQDLFRQKEQQQHDLDVMVADFIRRGLALPGSNTQKGHVFIRGQSHLLQDVKAVEDLEHARALFEMLEEQDTLLQILDNTKDAQGIQVFIGSENKMFRGEGWSTVLSPYRDAEGEVLGVIGVIGPVRLNYGRILPIVDYTSKVMEKLLRKGEALV